MQTLLLIFVLNLVTSTMSQLKYMLASKPNSWEMYLIIALDSVLYLYSLTLVIGDTNSLISIVVLTLGKLLGVTLSNIIDQRFVDKIYLYNFYFSSQKEVELLEDLAQKEHLSMSTSISHFKDHARYTTSMHLNKNQVKLVKDFLKDQDITITADALLVNSTFGHIKNRV